MSDDKRDPAAPLSELDIHTLAMFATFDTDGFLDTAARQWHEVKHKTAGAIAHAIVLGKGGDAAEIKAMLRLSCRAAAIASMIDNVRADATLRAGFEPSEELVEALYQASQQANEQAAKEVFARALVARAKAAGLDDDD